MTKLAPVIGVYMTKLAPVIGVYMTKLAAGGCLPLRRS